ncbi:MAG: peptidoglycan DD-metalloendopeptidase family protein [Parvularculaceae bacterium]
MNRTFVTLILSTALLCPAALASAQDETESARQLKEIEAKLQANERKAEAIRQAAEQRQDELRLLTNNMIDAANSLRETEAHATELETSLAALEQTISIAEVDLEAKQHSLSKILAALQQLELSRPPALAVSPADATEAARAAITISAIAPDLQAKAETLQAEIVSVSRLRAQKNIERQELAKVETDLGARKRILQELRDDKETEFRAESAQIVRLERENARLAAKATSIRDLMAGITATGPVISPSLGPSSGPRSGSSPSPRQIRPATVNTPAPADTSETIRRHNDLLAGLPSAFRLAKGKLPAPVAGRIVSKYGSTTPSGKKLEGVYIETRDGGVVSAPFDGKIAFADNLKDIGNLIVINVGEGYFLVLVGLSPEAKKLTAGTLIKAGEPLGYMPKSTNPGERQRLYFEVRRTISQNVTETIDPAKWFAKTK